MCSQTDEEPGPPLKENATGAWSAVERECHGTFGFVLHTIPGIGNEEDLGARLFDFGVLVGDLLLQDHRPCSDSVLDLLSTYFDRVLAFDKVILGCGSFFFFLFGYFGHGGLQFWGWMFFVSKAVD